MDPMLLLFLVPTFLAIVTDRWKRSQAWYRRSAFQKFKDRLTYIFQWNLVGIILIPALYGLFTGEFSQGGG